VVRDLSEHAVASPSADQAFSALVEQHVPGLVRLARRFVRSRDLAWDAVQLSLLTLWQTPQRPDAVRPWLARTVVLRCLHLRRTLRRRQHYEDLAGRAAAEQTTVEDPASRLERRAREAALQQALPRLRSDHRQVFLLREVEGLDYAQIGRRLRIPIGTVRSRLARARSALRQTLRGSSPTG
jgi:RNA polymerase sigma-70 factor (ECF subfamily)